MKRQIDSYRIPPCHRHTVVANQTRTNYCLDFTAARLSRHKWGGGVARAIGAFRSVVPAMGPVAAIRR